VSSEAFGKFAGQRVVVTGGLGFIGSNLAHSLVEGGAEVAIIDSLDPRSGGDIANIKGIDDSVELVSADICEFDAVASVVQNAAFLFHCAAHTSHPYSMRDPQLDVTVNCIGTLNILEALRRFQPAARLVYVGTSTQIGPMIAKPITERHPVAPVDIYSANKAAAEYYCCIYASAYDMAVNSVRLPNVYGPRANISSPDFGFINYFIGLALRDQSLTIYGDGEQLRSVLYVQDAVTAFALAAQANSRGKIWFAGDDRSVSVKELAESIVATCGAGRVLHVEWPDDRKRIDVGDIVIDSAQIKADLGWKAAVGLEEGMRATVGYFRASG
jgi:UDP-glucose 4-epimerase